MLLNFIIHPSIGVSRMVDDTYRARLGGYLVYRMRVWFFAEDVIGPFVRGSTRDACWNVVGRYSIALRLLRVRHL